MNLELIDGGPPLTGTQIDELETRFGIRLPSEYRIFLLHHNGGVPHPRAFPIKNFKNNPKGLLQVFFRLTGGIESTQLDWNYKIFKSRIPDFFFRSLAMIRVGWCAYR